MRAPWRLFFCLPDGYDVVEPCLDEHLGQELHADVAAASHLGWGVGVGKRARGEKREVGKIPVSLIVKFVSWLVLGRN